MKKQINNVKLHKKSSDQIAKDLKKGVGQAKAYSIADSLVRNLTAIKPDEFDHELFTMKSLKKGINRWTQVRSLLKK